MDENVNPATETQSPMDRLGAILEAEEAQRQPEQGQAQEATEPEVENDSDNPFDPEAQSEDQAPEDNEELVEIELDGGEKIPARVPKGKGEIAKAGYMKDADYRKKTEEAAIVRKNAETALKTLEEAATQTQAVRQYLGQMHAIDAQLEQYNALNWAEIRANNPEQYPTLVADVQRLQAQRQQVMQAGTQAWEAVAAKREEAMKAMMAETRDVVARKIKGWNEEANRVLGEYVSEKGVRETSVQALKTDPALVEMAWKARQFDKLQAARPEAKKLPPMPTAKPGAKASVQTPIKAARQELKKTGSLFAAAKLINL